jgi:hypothetical protein
MTRSIQRSMARMVVAGTMTVAALSGSVAVAGVASAAPVTPPDVTSTSTAPVTDEATDQAANTAAEDTAKEAEKAAKEAAKEAEKAAEQAAKEAEKAAKEAEKAAEKAAKEAEKVAEEQVEYAEGDVIDKLGKVVKAKAPKLSLAFDEIAPALRSLVAGALTKQGATVVYDGRGQLVIAPYLCNPKKLRILQPGCVTSLPTLPGGGRF